MKIHDVGRLYVTRMRFPELEHLPLALKGWTAETDEPWRVGTSLVVRIPGTRWGVVVGWWGPPRSELETLTLATGMRELTEEECRELSPLEDLLLA